MDRGVCDGFGVSFGIGEGFIMYQCYDGDDLSVEEGG